MVLTVVTMVQVEPSPLGAELEAIAAQDQITALVNDKFGEGQ